VKARFTVKVQPRARVSEAAGKAGDSYKLRLAAPPADGRANEECIRLLAGLFDVPRAAVRIVSGLTARTKIVEIDGIDPASVERRLSG
jgi:uncharacterized protein (TIGR00251 family)